MQISTVVTCWSNLTRVLPELWSLTNLQSHCMVMTTNLRTLSTWLNFLQAFARENRTKTSLSSYHIFQSGHFLRRSPKAISLSFLLNIAEDNTEYMMAEQWYRHWGFFICLNQTAGMWWIWREYKLCAREITRRHLKLFHTVTEFFYWIFYSCKVLSESFQVT